VRVEVPKSSPETIVTSSLASGDHSLLLDIANLLSNELEPELLFDTIAHVVRQFLNIDRASIALYDSERDAFEIVAIALHENTRPMVSTSASSPPATATCERRWKAGPSGRTSTTG
jgi:GAF domain-containing protein